MAIKSSNTRLWITIHKSTKQILDKLQPLFPEMTQSQIVDYAIVCFGEAVIERAYQHMKGENNENN